MKWEENNCHVCDFTFYFVEKPEMLQLSRALLSDSFSQARLVFRAVPALVALSQPARQYLHQEAPDYYTILGVGKTSSLAEIKLAYFNMAKRFHPETNKTLDARQMFSLIAEAYEAGWSTLIGRGPSRLCSDWLMLLT